MSDRQAERRASLPYGKDGAVVTCGTFDGVHRGHALVLERTAERARQSGLTSIALTFDPHPLDVVNPSAAPPLLTLWDEKLEVLAQTPVDYVAVVPFTAELASFTAEQFVDRVLIDAFGMRELLIAHDHGFGRIAPDAWPTSWFSRRSRARGPRVGWIANLVHCGASRRRSRRSRPRVGWAGAPLRIFGSRRVRRRPRSAPWVPDAEPRARFAKKVATAARGVCRSRRGDGHGVRWNDEPRPEAHIW
jgi:hypothetical protein